MVEFKAFQVAKGFCLYRKLGRKLAPLLSDWIPLGDKKVFSGDPWGLFRKRDS